MMKNNIIIVIILAIISLLLILILLIDSNYNLNNQNSNTKDIIVNDHTDTHKTVINDNYTIDNIVDSTNVPVRQELNGDNEYVISGKIIDKITKKPLQQFDIEILWSSNGVMNNIQESISDNNGLFRYSFQRKGIFKIRISTSTHRVYVKSYELDNEIKSINLMIEMDPGLAIEGIVIDAENKRPISGVLVTVGYFNLDILLQDGRTEAYPNCRTNQDGHFMLRGLFEEDNDKILAIHDDYAIEDEIESDQDNQKVVIRLEKGYRFFGEVKDDYGRPAINLKININMIGNRVKRNTTTDKNGKYRSKPVKPGKYLLIASGVPNKFSEEKKPSQIIDSDIRVDFGPHPDHVTWMGSLYDYDGRLIPRAEISIRSTDRIEKTKERYLHVFKTNDKGEFIARKIILGKYDIIIIWNDHRGCGTRKEMFSKTGVIKKDIRLSGAVIKGYVIDEKTNKPLMNVNGWVTARNKDNRERYSVRFGNNGEYCIRTLPSGIYELNALTDDRRKSRIIEIFIAHSDIVEDIKVIIPSHGKLELLFEEFTAHDIANLFCTLYHKDCELTIKPRKVLYENDLYKYEAELYEGKWNLIGISEGVAGETYNEEIYIMKGRKTKVKINKMYVEDYIGKIDLDLLISYTNGSPVSNLDVIVKGVPNRVPDKCRGIEKRVVTNNNGRIYIEDLSPGWWKAVVRINNTQHSRFIIMPMGQDGIVTREIVISRGSINGKVLDGNTFSPLDNYTTVIRNVRTRPADYYFPDLLDETSKKGMFRIDGVPMGRYELSISKKGYISFKQEIIINNVNVDIDDIILKPVEK